MLRCCTQNVVLEDIARMHKAAEPRVSVSPVTVTVMLSNTGSTGPTPDQTTFYLLSSIKISEMLRSKRGRNEMQVHRSPVQLLQRVWVCSLLMSKQTNYYNKYCWLIVSTPVRKHSGPAANHSNVLWQDQLAQAAAAAAAHAYIGHTCCCLMQLYSEQGFTVMNRNSHYITQNRLILRNNP